MNTRKLIFVLLIVSLIGFGAGYVLTNSIKFKLCLVDKVVTDASCINFYERIGDPLFYGMGALSFVFLILMFVPQTFPAWKKFAKYFIPLMALLFIFYPEPGSGNFLYPYPEQVFRSVSVFYVAVSAVVIARSLFRQRMKKTIA